MSAQAETKTLQSILQDLSPAERDALSVLINNYGRELSAQSIQRLLPEKPSLAATRAVLQNLAQRNLVIKRCAQSWSGRFSVAPDVMKLVRE